MAGVQQMDVIDRGMSQIMGTAHLEASAMLKSHRLLTSHFSDAMMMRSMMSSTVAVMAGTEA